MFFVTVGGKNNKLECLSLGSLIFESIAGPCSTENFLGTNSLAYFIPRQ